MPDKMDTGGNVWGAS